MMRSTSSLPGYSDLLQGKAAPGKGAGPAAPQQAAAKAKDGSSNAAVASRLLSTEALMDKIIEWAPEVRGCRLSLSAFRAYLILYLLCIPSESYICTGLCGSTHRIAYLCACVVSLACLVRAAQAGGGGRSRCGATGRSGSSCQTACPGRV